MPQHSPDREDRLARLRSAIDPDSAIDIEEHLRFVDETIERCCGSSRSTAGFQTHFGGVRQEHVPARLPADYEAVIR
jgi:hypothetical protein